MKAKLTLYGREMVVDVDVNPNNPGKLKLNSIKLEDIAFLRDKMKTFGRPDVIDKLDYKTDGLLTFDPIHYEGAWPLRIGDILLDFDMERVSTTLDISTDWYSIGDEK